MGGGSSGPKTELTASTALSPLVAILSAEQAIYDELLVVAEEERAAIVEAQLSALKSVIERKQHVLARLAELEEQRVNWARRYARRNQLDVDALTLSTIVNRSSGDDHRLLLRAHRGLNRRVAKIMDLDRVTRSLLESILKSIDVSLRYLLSDDCSGQVYASKGQLQPTFIASRQLLDYRA